MTLTSVESFAVLVIAVHNRDGLGMGPAGPRQGPRLSFGVQATATAAAALATVLGCPACGLVIVLAGSLPVFLPRSFKDNPTEAWWSAAGVCYAGFPAVALIWLRGDGAYGMLAVLYLFAIVWTTDSAAFLFGRAIGGPRLAPRISPKKTWAGLIGATLSSAIVGLVFGLVFGIFSLWLAVLGMVLAVVAQLGDLGELGIKRIFGTKDSSSLIPGHGGVLDRIDGLIFAAILAGVLAWIVNPENPGQALLLWP